MKVQLIKEFFIEAAHSNPKAGLPASRLHGHSFRIEVIVEGEVDPIRGWLIDYGDIKAAFRPLRDRLDHSNLNEIEGMDDATIADVAAWIEERLAPKLPGLKGVRVSVLGDNGFSPKRVPADPDRDLPERIAFSFDAAQRLPNLPEGHPCRNLHGHTYHVEVGAEDMDGLLGLLAKLHDSLDHRCLNDMPDLDEATSERLCAWIWNKLAADARLTVVVVQETATARCIYHGE
jgi:6-pyruvoyltetrahydropterin/6-carboxytetrahydropterin synthase